MTFFQRIMCRLFGWEYVAVERRRSFYVSQKLKIVRRLTSPRGDQYCWWNDDTLLRLNSDGTAGGSDDKYTWWEFSQPEPAPAKVRVTVVSVVAHRHGAHDG